MAGAALLASAHGASADGLIFTWSGDENGTSYARAGNLDPTVLDADGNVVETTATLPSEGHWAIVTSGTPTMSNRGWSALGLDLSGGLFTIRSSKQHLSDYTVDMLKLSGTGLLRIARRRLWQPLPNFANLDGLNAWLEERCIAQWGQIVHGNLPGSVADAHAGEVASLMPLGRPFDGFVEETKGGAVQWVDVYEAIKAHEAWQVTFKSVDEKTKGVLSAALTARTLGEIGVAAGQSVKYATYNGGGKRALIAANDNFAAAAKKYAA